MGASTYEQRRSEIQTYFDSTAVEAWSRLTTDAPVGRIRQTVREGRDTMRNTLLSWLAEDLRGKRILDAGCGTGALAVEAARRGADVVAMDLSPTLVELARERVPADLGNGRITFMVGDMSTPEIGDFDHVVAMDSLIHYQLVDVLEVVSQMTSRARSSVLFTFAPRTALLGTMHAVGQLFPRNNRSPAIEPVAEKTLRERLREQQGMTAWRPNRSERVSRGFYISQALELLRE